MYACVHMHGCNILRLSNAEIHKSLNSSEDTNFIAFCGFCLDGYRRFQLYKGGNGHLWFIQKQSCPF